MLNMSKIITLAFCAIWLCLLPGRALGASTNAPEPQGFNVSMEFETPHIKWLKPSANTALKVLFIAPRGSLREVVELAQRMDLDFQVVGLAELDVFVHRSPNDKNFGNAVYGMKRNITTSMLKQDLENKLKQSYDLIVIGMLNWTAFPYKCRYQILKKVKEGTPLLAMLGDVDEYFTQATKTKNKPEISFLYPYRGLPAYANYADFKGMLSSNLTESRFGKGKIIQQKFFRTGAMLTPQISGNILDLKMLEYDYYLAYVIHLMRYAAGVSAAVAIQGKDSIKAENNLPGPVEFSLVSKERKNVTCRFALRNCDNNVLTETAKKINLKDDVTPVAFNVGKLPAGNYFADLWVCENDKILDFGSVYIDVRSSSSITAININKSYPFNSGVTGQVSLSTADNNGNLSLRIKRKDNFSRITGITNQPVKNEKTIAFTLPPQEDLTTIQFLEVELLNGNEILDRKRAAYSVSNRPHLDDFRYIFWPGWANAGSYLFQYYLSAHYNAGFDTMYGDDWQVRPVSLANLGFIDMPSRMGSIFTDDKTAGHNRSKDDHIRAPCLTAPETRKKAEDSMTNAAARMCPFSVNEFSMGDELSFVWGGRFELCYSPSCVEVFHTFLRNEYKTVENMNKEYESGYKSFEDVKPVTLQDVKNNHKLIPLWVDYRKHMDSVWADTLKYCGECASKIIPGCRIGYEGTEGNDIDSMQARDFEKLMNAINLNCTYDGYFVPYAMADFSRPGTLFSSGWYGGYSADGGAWDHPDNLMAHAYKRYLPWRNLFRGSNSLWVWWTHPGGGLSAMAMDFSFYDFFKATLPEVRAIKTGIGKLFMTATRNNDGLAILYSPNSVHASKLTESAGLPAIVKVLNSLIPILEDTGHQFQIVSSRQIEEDILLKSGFRFIYLPLVQSISETQAKALISFVDKGGTILADMRPGVCDDHGKPYPKGILDDVFGVRQDTANPTFNKGIILTQASGFPTNFTAISCDSSIKLAGGQSKGNLNKSPVFIVNSYGKGKTILLNYPLLPYEDGMGEWWIGDKLAKNAEIVRKASEVTFDTAGFERKIKITPEVPGLRTYMYNSGNLEYLGVLRELPAGDNSYYKWDGKSPIPVVSTVINLSGKRHVYNMRTRKYLGFIDQIPAEIETGRVLLYSLLPYPVAGLKLDIPRSIKQGENFTYKVQLSAGKEHIGQHVFHVSFINPAGGEVEYYAANIVAQGGAASNRVSLAFNEFSGRWKIIVRDVASGAEMDKTFKVETANDK